MKKTRILFILTSLLLICSSCVSLKRMLDYEPISVEMSDPGLIVEGGKVPVGIDVVVSPEYKNTHTAVEFHPVVTDEAGNKVELKAFEVEGGRHNMFNRRMQATEPLKQDGIKDRTRYKKDTPYIKHYVASFPYEEWMDGSTLRMDVIGNAYTRDIDLGSHELGYEVINLDKYIVRKPYEMYFNYCGEQERDAFLKAIGNSTIIKAKGESSITIPFATDDNKIDASFYSGEFAELLKSLQNNRCIEFLKMNAVIANSPEASVQHNAALGQKRKDAVCEYLRSFGVNPAECSFNLIVEDWDTIVESIKSTGLVNGKEILDIINSESDLDQRENLIRSKYPAAYKTMCKTIFPKARRAELLVSAKYPVGEGAGYENNVAYKDGICIINLMPKSTDNSKELNAQLLEAVQAGNYGEAAAIAEKISYDSCDDYVRCNKAMAYFMNGRLDDARAIYERIYGIREADYNLGLIYLIQQKYEDANEILDKYADMNAAIAKFGIRDYEGAASTLRLLPASANRDKLIDKALEYINKQKSNN